MTWTPKPPKDPQLARWAASRGLPLEILTRHLVYLSDDEKPGWVAFTYRNLTGVWPTRYRRPDHITDGPKYWAPTGSGTHLYNPLGLGPDADRVVFCEGEVDTLTALAAGLPAVGIPGVGHTKGIFSRLYAMLFETAKVTLAFDNDKAGLEATNVLKDRFPGCRIVTPPEGDLNDWWRADPQGLKAAFA